MNKTDKYLLSRRKPLMKSHLQKKYLYSFHLSNNLNFNQPRKPYLILRTQSSPALELLKHPFSPYYPVLQLTLLFIFRVSC